MLRRAISAAFYLAATAAIGYAQAPPQYVPPPGFKDPIFAPQQVPVPVVPTRSQYRLPGQWDGFDDPTQVEVVRPSSQGYRDPNFGVQPASIPVPPPPIQGFNDPIFVAPPMPSSQSFARDTIFAPQPAPMLAPVVPVSGTAPDGGLFQQCPPPDAPPPAKLWKGSFETALAGATGNTEILNYRFFATADRKTDTNLFHTDVTYLLGKEDGKSTQNNMIANLRDEVLIAGSPWSYFGSSFFDYDELRDYKTILGLYAGLGYLVSDTDTQFFKLRFGAGTIYKTSGSAVPGHVWEPSLDFGYDYKYKITERSAFISTLDYYPSVDKGFGEYLLRLRAAYECTLDPKTGLYFRVGIFERYDSNPGPGYEKSDLNYFTALGFNF